jgi:acyl-CoA thioester hydrolase
MDAYGHVNNIMFFRYFENSRLELFRVLGWPVGQRPSGVGPILAETRCRFRKPLAFPDRIAVGIRITDVAEDRFSMEHLLVSQQWNAVAAEGSGLVVTFDYQAGRKAPLPDQIRQQLLHMGGSK